MMTAPPPFLKRQLIALLFWFALIAALVVYSSQHNLTPLAATRQLTTALADMPIHLRGLIFTAVYTVRPLVFFPASILTLAIGALCGPLWGIVYAVLGSNLSASLAYVVGRLLRQDVVASENQNALQRYLQRMRHNSFETIFIMRLILLPYDLVNYAAGFLKINYVPFILATMLGSIPGTVSFVLFGASSGLESGTPKFDWRILVISVLIFGTSLVVSRLVKRREGVA
ncbi:MAG: TVP38/TMEM64 family protein [Trueperaceae bacterium]